ncbi:MAG TPA: hypothetical protein PK224_13635 [Nitrospira sp.]|jgi:hypothetical protein|nr:hypothetical protein [Nitrospira sp.]
MDSRLSDLSNVTQPEGWNAADQNLLVAALSAMPAQRLAWLEETLHLAYASGALKTRALITQDDWGAASSRSR